MQTLDELRARGFSGKLFGVWKCCFNLSADPRAKLQSMFSFDWRGSISSSSQAEGFVATARLRKNAAALWEFDDKQSSSGSEHCGLCARGQGASDQRARTDAAKMLPCEFVSNLAELSIIDTTH